jgi:adenylate cyclase
MGDGDGVVAAGAGGLDERSRAAWQHVLVEGDERLTLVHRMFRHLPGPPRCKLCHNPFGGVGGRVVGLFGFKPSRKNPNLCTRCCEALPAGGLEVDIAVLFADVRGSTALAERVGPGRYAELLNYFYRTATAVLVRHDAIIDKLIGDEVMALFIPGIAGPEYRRRAALAATELLGSMAREPALPVGAAVAAGIAYVGNVGGDHIVDFTALGDPVNLSARLQAQAEPGQAIFVDDVYEHVIHEFPETERRELTVRGREAPVVVNVVTVTD